MNLFKKVFLVSNKIRIGIFNLIFWIIIGVLVFSIFSLKEDVATGKILVINPVGDIFDTPTEVGLTDFLRSNGNDIPKNTLLSDITFAVERAANDRGIHELVIDLDYMGYIGYGSMEEIGKSLKKFKDQGKKITAFSSFYSQEAYYIASFADEVIMDPYGDVYFNGLGIYRNYYKDLLDKYNVDVNVFRAGGFKSYVEPYIGNSMSKEVKNQNLLWMNDIWLRLLTVITYNRDFPEDIFLDFVENKVNYLKTYNGSYSDMALNMKLVDSLKSSGDFYSELGNYYGFKDYNEANSSLILGDRIGVITIEGAITYGDSSPGSVSAVEIMDQIDTVIESNEYSAMIIRINSGGGGVFASEEIRRKVEDANEHIPVVVSMGDVCASGGYWIASAGDYIIANSTTITGSIGVFGLQIGFEDTLREHLGVYNDGIGTLYNSGDGSLSRNLSKKSAQEFQLSVDDTYNRFLNLITESRGIDRDSLKKIAEGRVWSGLQAMEHRLVDNIGSFQDALEYLDTEYGIDDDVEFIVPEPGLFASIMSFFTAKGPVSDSVLLKMVMEAEKDILLNKIDDPKGLYSIWY